MAAGFAAILFALLARATFGEDTCFLQFDVNVSLAPRDVAAAQVGVGGNITEASPQGHLVAASDPVKALRRHFRDKVSMLLILVGCGCGALCFCEMLSVTVTSASGGRRAGQAVYVLSNLLAAVGQGMLLTVSLPLASFLGYSPAASGFLSSASSLGGLIAQAMMVYLAPQAALTHSPHKLLRAGSIAATFLHMICHAIFVVALVLHLPDTPRWWLLCASRTCAGFFMGLGSLFTGVLAFTLTPANEMLNLQTAVQGALGTGQCLASLLASLALVAVHLSGNEQTSAVLEAGAAPVMLFVPVVCGLLAILVLLVPRETGVHVDAAAETVPEVKTASELSVLDVAEQKTLFRSGIIYNFERTFSIAAIEVATTMISQVEFGFSPVTTGWIFSLIAVGSVMANIIVGLSPVDVDWRTSLMVWFAFVGVLTVPFLLDWWPWWTLYLADALMMTVTNAANGVADGVVIMAMSGEQGLTRQTYINQKMLSMAVAKVAAAPMARGVLPWLGRNGYGCVQMLVTAAGFLGVYKMYRVVSSRKT